MTDNANKKILDRDKAANFGTTISEPLDSLRDFVDYGTHLVLRCYYTSEKSLKDVVALFSLFKNALSMADAIEVMMRQGIIRPSQLQLRSLFEVSVTLQWVLQESGDERARAYHVANLRRQLLWANRYLPDTDENKAFEYFWDTVGNRTTSPEGEKEARAQIDNLNKALSIPSMCDLNEKFETFYQKNKREKDWYKILGVPSFWKIAKEVGHTAEYAMIYASGSEVMHGSTYSGQLAFDDSEIIIDPMRSPEETGYSLTLAMALTIRMIQSTLKHYRPAELKDFARKYAKDWNFPLRRIPDIRVEQSTVTLDR